MKYQNSHPIVVDAMHYDGRNYNDVCKFCGNKIETKECTGDFPCVVLGIKKRYIVIPAGYYLVKTKNKKIYVYTPESFE
jgi:hypothetical protein